MAVNSTMARNRLTFAIGLTLVATFVPLAAATAEAVPAAAAEAASDPRDAVLIDIWGSRRTLQDFADDEATALVCLFMGTECPLVRLYVPTLNRLDEEFRPQGARFLGVYSNTDDSVFSIACHGQETNMRFPALKDEDGRLAELLGASRTPEVIVLNSDFQICYRGQINDQYRPGARKSQASRHYLVDALNDVISGQAVELSQTLGLGCHIETRDPAEEQRAVTFYGDVLPVLRDSCQSCHRAGAAAPFPLMTYEQVRRHREMIGEVVRGGRMPPWGAVMNEELFGPLRDDCSMSADEVELILTWLRQGTPEGDRKLAPPTPQWDNGWSIGQPDLVVKMPKPFEVPADGELDYQFVKAKLNFQEDRWVKAVEVRPGAPGVVHHMHAHVISPRVGKLFGWLGMLRLYGTDGKRTRVLGSYLPGRPPIEFPAGTAMRIPAGYDLMFEIHYTPNGTPVSDQSSIAMIFADGPPQLSLRDQFMVMKGFTVAAGDPHHVESLDYTFRRKSLLYSVTPHMHKRGKHWRYEIEYPDGRIEKLVSIPRWDFDWQHVYTFERPIELPAKTKIRAIGCWDNSLNNPNNPDATVDASFGLQSYDEMMVARFTFAEVNEAQPPATGDALK